MLCLAPSALPFLKFRADHQSGAQPKAFRGKPESGDFNRRLNVIHPIQEDWIMSAPFPFALRARFQRDIEEGLSGRAAALRSKLSAATFAAMGHSGSRHYHVTR